MAAVGSATAAMAAMAMASEPPLQLEGVRRAVRGSWCAGGSSRQKGGGTRYPPCSPAAATEIHRRALRNRRRRLNPWAKAGCDHLQPGRATVGANRGR